VLYYSGGRQRVVEKREVESIFSTPVTRPVLEGKEKGKKKELIIFYGISSIELVTIISYGTYFFKENPLIV
jgi:hypothetical protein